MGCDIHIFIEKKTEEGWKEVDFGWLVPDERCYELFGFLSNVRGCSDSPKMKSNWPKNSELKEDEGYHNHGHAYVKDILKWDWPEELEDCYFKVFIEYIIPLHPDTEWFDAKDIRVLVCYDS